MKPGKVRSIAVCILDNDKKQILVSEEFDHVRKETFFHTLGVKIEFGELVADTVRRELVDCRSL